MEINRRRFLGMTLGATAGAAVGIPLGRTVVAALASADNSLYPPRGPEKFVLSVCSLCPGGCGLRVRCIGERVVKLEGNPLHPVNAGRLCPKGQAALQGLYHPDRIPGPLRRTGPRGSIRSFEPVTWDQALGEVATRLHQLRASGRPESLALLRGHSPGIGARLAPRFLHAFGSPNDVVLDRGDEAATLALYLTQGVRTVPAYDIQSTDYVLSLGSALLEASSSPVHMARAYGAFRQGRTGRRGKLVHVEPRLSITASSADEWIAVRPGTEGIFALGVAAVIVSEGLNTRDFVLERSLGLEEHRDPDGKLVPGLRTLLERDFTLERVAAETQVSVNVILRIAREFAAARSSLAVGPRHGPLLPGRLFDHLAAQVLNGLMGNIDAPGGVLVPEETPFAPWPDLPPDAVAETGRARPRLDAGRRDQHPLLVSDPEQLAEAILAGAPYTTEALFVLGADPLFASAAPDRFAAALERVPLVVSFGNMPDDTSVHADWILPQAHFLERWDLYTTPPGIGYPLASLAQPALPKPLHDVRPLADILLDLARRVGPQVAAAFPWTDVHMLLRSEMDGLFAARRGAIMGTPFDEAWVRMMERAGWWAPGYHSADELWTKAQTSGGWWDPFYDHGDWRRVLRTRSGRFEFRADLLQQLPPGTAATGSNTGATPPAAARDGLALLLFEPLPIAGGCGAELPFLQGILDPGHEARWETWAEIHPETAHALGVGDREWVRIETDRGVIVARTRVGPRVVRGVVAVPVGLGKRAGGRWASGLGANPLRLLSGDRDPLCGLPDFGATIVRVSAAAEPADLRTLASRS